MNDWSEIWLNEGFASFYVGDFLKQDHPYLASSEYYLHLAQLLAKQVLILSPLFILCSSLRKKEKNNLFLYALVYSWLDLAQTHAIVAFYLQPSYAISLNE